MVWFASLPRTVLCSPLDHRPSLREVSPGLLAMRRDMIIQSHYSTVYLSQDDITLYIAYRGSCCGFRLSMGSHRCLLASTRVSKASLHPTSSCSQHLFYNHLGTHLVPMITRRPQRRCIAGSSTRSNWYLTPDPI